jgi:hypothetical protein
MATMRAFDRKQHGGSLSVWADVRYGTKADIEFAPVDVRFTPESGP